MGRASVARTATSVISVDERRWPLVVIVWPAEPLADESVEEFLRISQCELERREPQFTLHEIRGASGLDARQRRRIAQFVEEHRDEIARYVAASAIVNTSPVLRAMITAIHWLSPPPYREAVFATRTDAEAWLTSIARASRVTIPAEAKAP